VHRSIERGFQRDFLLHVIAVADRSEVALQVLVLWSRISQAKSLASSID